MRSLLGRVDQERECGVSYGTVPRGALRSPFDRASSTSPSTIGVAEIAR
jgi:hypothetical protein